ncbi:unnamed protein product [Absidia cylindrospora]
MAEYQLPYANWKDQYRIHQNWLTGYCTSYRLDNVAALSYQSNTWNGHKLQGLLQYTNDILCICSQSRKQVEIWHTGKTATRHIGNLKDDTLDDRRKITFMKLKTRAPDDSESIGNQQNYTLIIGNNYGGFGTWKFTTATDTTRTKLVGIRRTCHYQQNNHKDPVVAMDVLHPMLILCTANMKLQAFDIDQPSPRQIFKIESPVRWCPVVVHLSQHHLPSQWKALLCFGVNFGLQSSLGAQEMIFSIHGITSSRHSSIFNPISSTHERPNTFYSPPTLSPPTSSPPTSPSPSSLSSSPSNYTNATCLNDLFPDSINNPTMTSMVYSDPFIMTAYSTNTIRQYRVKSTDDGFHVDFVKTLFGHTCQVSSLALDVDEGRLISGSRAGLKLWDLLSLDQYTKRANDYVVTLQPEESGAMDIPMDDIIWMQVDKVKIIALLRNGDSNKKWFKIWSFDP